MTSTRILTIHKEDATEYEEDLEEESTSPPIRRTRGMGRVSPSLSSAKPEAKPTNKRLDNSNDRRKNESTQSEEPYRRFAKQALVEMPWTQDRMPSVCATR